MLLSLYLVLRISALYFVLRISGMIRSTSCPHKYTRYPAPAVFFFTEVQLHTMEWSMAMTAVVAVCIDIQTDWPGCRDQFPFFCTQIYNTRISLLDIPGLVHVQVLVLVFAARDSTLTNVALRLEPLRHWVCHASRACFRLKRAIKFKY